MCLAVRNRKLHLRASTDLQLVAKMQKSTVVITLDNVRSVYHFVIYIYIYIHIYIYIQSNKIHSVVSMTKF